MKSTLFFREIQKRSPLFILDDIQEIVVKAILNDNEVEYYIKHKGCKEVKITAQSSIVYDAIMGGEFITQKDYESF